MRLTPLVLLACFLFSGASPLFLRGIDLVALKKKEEERRKKIGKSKLAVNDTNVNSVSVGDKKYGFVQMEADEPPVGGESAGVPVSTKKKDVTQQPDFWKKQQDELEERIAKLKVEIEQGQSDVNKLWTDYYIKNIAAEQAAIRAQIAQLTAQIEQKKAFLEQSETQLEDLYEKARKAGIPPGWLR
jgi:uncharacterized small protein (DUF1192 family)